MATSAALALGAALVVAVVVLAARSGYVGVRAGRADENYLTSPACLACHPDHHASWARTFHSRMTREARPDSVQGDFERDNTFDYLGVQATMERRDGRFAMTLALPGGRRLRYAIDRTVGSRRIEQYLSRQGGHYLRLPLAYDLVHRRWMSLNGSFFYPDGENYFQHQAEWDANCVFCHNVKAQPRRDPRTGTFATEVTELGIACGACHGPAARHADAASSPFTRAWWRLARAPDTLIVNPRRLTAERATMVCGHCHGQRVPDPLERIQDILATGDPYNAGDDLATFYRPVWRETRVGAYAFASRFWANGSPRLTAYEYQGLLRSRCLVNGDRAHGIGCLTCHSMHDGDPRGQIRPENRTDKPCLACHRRYEAPAALVTHTRHRADSAGSRCYACHMPRVVYGIMAIHRTHEITVPDPRVTASHATPNACTQCHLDRSVNWAIAASRRLWPERFGAAESARDEMFELPEGLRALFAGEALMRALAAEALGGGGPMTMPREWAGPYLLEAFDDNYPIVRFFAAQGLAADRQGRPALDYLADAPTRRRAVEQWWAMFPAARPRVAALAQALRDRRINVDIEVGE